MNLAPPRTHDVSVLCTLARRPSLLLIVALLVLGSVDSVAPANTQAPEADRSGEKLLNLLRKLPLQFEPNRGQASEGARFVSRTPGLTVSLGEAGVELRPHSGNAIWMTWVGQTGGTAFEGVDRLEGHSNYLRGSDPKRWHTKIPQFRKVRQREIYPGIDVVFYGNGQQLEFDFVVSPGTDPDRVEMAFQGAERVEINEEGDLVFETPSGELRSRRPHVYQMRGGVEEVVESSYVFRDEDRVGFALGEHDPTLALIIDPKVDFASYMAGEDDDGARGVTTDSEGNTFITGYSEFSEAPPQFPSTEDSYQPDHFGEVPGDAGEQGEIDPELDAFVWKMNEDGSALKWGTFLGGEDFDIGKAIAIDAEGNVYICGETNSSSFPTTVGAFQRGRPGFGLNSFVAKLSADGSELDYATYLGGIGIDHTLAHDIAVDAAGAAIVTGQTRSSNYPTTAGTVGPTPFGGDDIFVTHLSADGSSLLSSTFLGGSGEDIGYGVMLDGDGNPFVAGSTASADFPAPKAAFQRELAGGTDAFVAKLSPALDSLGYATLVGGTSDDEAQDVYVQADGSASIVGTTESDDLPIGDSAFDDGYNGQGDVLIATVGPDGTTASCTYLGGSKRDRGYSLVVTAAGDIIVVGQTRSEDFPVSDDAPQDSLRTNIGDAFLTQISVAGELVDSTYYGSGNEDIAHSVALAADGGPVMVGVTNHDPNPIPSLSTTSTSFQRLGIDDLDGFVVKYEGADLTLPSITTEGVVNAASFVVSVAPDSIGTAFVLNAVNSKGTLPTVIDGTTLEITDSAGATRATNLFGIFADGKQINFYVDPDTAVGQGTITLRRGDGASSSTPIEVKSINPGIFFLTNASDQAVALAQFIRISGGAAGPLELTFNSADFSLVPIDLGPEADQVFIALFGTGIRLVSGVDKVTATIGGQAVPVTAVAGAAGFFGLDQVNIGPIPRSLIGQGPVVIILTVDGVVANAVMVSIL